MNVFKKDLSKKIGGKRISLFAGAILALLLSVTCNVFAQQWGRVSLTRGKVWLTMQNSLQYGAEMVDLPSAYYALCYPGYSTGADLWDHLAYLVSGGYLIYGEREGEAAAYTIGSVFYPSSKYVSPTEDAELIKNYNMADPSLLAEEIATGAHHVKDLDVDVAHKSMVWSYPRYDDFVIHEYTITNTGSTDLSNLYFGIRLGCWITWKGYTDGPGDLGDEKYGWDEEHHCFYIYDDRTFHWETEVPIEFLFGPGPETGDIGDPADIELANVTNHELYSPGYLSIICLDSAGAHTFQNILQFLGQATSTDAPLEDFMVRLGTDPPSRFLEVMTHQQPRASWDALKDLGEEGGNKFERTPEFVISCGPYELVPGASVTVVFAEVLGEMDRAKIVEGGVDNINLLAIASRDSLLANVEACRELYANGYDAADPPPTPTNGENTLALTPVGGGVKIVWPPIPESYKDPDTGVNDFAGYRVYRSSYFCIGPWAQVVDISKGNVELEGGNVVYVDEGLPPGVGVYYTVTSYDDDGNESGKVNVNRYPVYPMRAPNESFPESVYVAPNPFKQRSGLLGSGEELRMEFIGIPARCVIRVYTLTGELVRMIKHEDGSGSEAWGSKIELDYQTNEWMQYVQPGVYIYEVESRVPGHESEKYIGKFAIIR